MAEEEKILSIKVETTDAINKIAEYRRLIDELKNKSGELDDKERKSIVEMTEAIRVLNKEVKNNLIIEKQKEGSLKSLRAELSKLTKQYDELSRTERESAKGTEIMTKLNNVTKELKEAEMATQRYYRNVGNYASAFNGLGMSVQQVARELPSLAMGWNTFFLAISNNLPILIDQVSMARKQFDELTKAGKTAVPVWRQLVSSVFSWQTALVVGITALTFYGKEIGNWISSLFRGEKAVNSLETAMTDFNKSVGDNSGGMIASVNKLSADWEKLGGILDKQKKFIEQNQSAFDKLGISIKSVSDFENAFIDNEDKLVKSIIARAKATAMMEAATELYRKSVQKQLELEKTPEKRRTFKTDSYYGAYTTSKESWVTNEDWTKLKSEIAEIEASAEKLITDYSKLSAEADDILGDAGIKVAEKATKKIKERAKKSVKDIADVLKALEKKIAEETEKRQQEYEMRLAKTRAEGAEEGTWAQHAANLELLRTQRDQELKEYGTTEEMRLAIKKKYDKLMNDENMTYHRNRIEAEKRTKEEEIAIQMEKLEAMSQVTGSLIDLIDAVGEGNKAAAIASKVIALAQIAIDTGVAISGGIAQAVKAGPFPANLVAIATTIATVMANIATAIQTVKSAKFSTGGDVSGEGTSTSDSIPAMLSDGESVMTAKATSMFAPILSAFNQAGGGVPIYGQQAGSRAMGEDMLAKSFAKGLANMPSPVVSVEEISTVSNRVKVIENINKI